MNIVKSVKTAVAVILVFAILFCLSACGAKNDGETTTQASVSATAYIPAQQADVTAESGTMPPETTKPATTAPAATTVPAETEAQTHSQAFTEAVEVSGTQTLTDGSKTVVYPSALANSQRKYPVIAWANGTSCPTELYTSLLEKLADGGYIVVADADTMAANGNSQIDSIN